MQTRQLGDSDLHITPIGLGTWALGGGHWDYGWGDQDASEAIDAIVGAVEAGINWVDTAAVYGLGRSEELVAAALQRLPASRRPFVFTKCSLVWDENNVITHSLKADSVRRELDASLRRLQCECIDLYQIHFPGYPPGGETPDIEEAMEVLVEQQKAGKIRHLGVSNFDAAQLERAGRIGRVQSLQPPYSLLNRSIEESILPYCAHNKIGTIVYSPLQSGLLSGAMTRERIAALPDNDWRKTKSEHFQEPLLSRNLRLVDRLREVADGHGWSCADVAVAWALRHPAVTAAIVGARRPAQLAGFLRAAEIRLEDREVELIESALAGE